MRIDVLKSNQRGIALIMVVSVLIVVSLGMIVLYNGVGNMNRSAHIFGSSDESYNAASAGLSVAHGYIAGLPFGTAPPACEVKTGSVGNGQYRIVIQSTLFSQDTDWVYLGTDPSDPNTELYKQDTVYDCNVSSTGSSNDARRVLETNYIVTFRNLRKDKTEIKFHSPEPQPPVKVPYIVSTYDILTGGSLTMEGDVDAGSNSKLHTNQDFTVNGNVNFGTVEVSGTASKKGNVGGTIISPVAPAVVPDVDWEAVQSSSLTEVKPATSYSGNTTVSIPAGKENLLYTGDLTIKGNFEFSGVKNLYVLGDFTCMGNFSATINIFVLGKVTISGNDTIYGMLYSGYNNTANDAIKISGNAKVYGGMITKGTIYAKGNVFSAAVGYTQSAQTETFYVWQPQEPIPAWEETVIVPSFETVQWPTQVGLVRDVPVTAPTTTP
ncbi:MAG: hypothetical protein ACM3ZC_14270 [Bacteroidota bacterium]